MKKLYIDTTSNTEATVRITINEVTEEVKQPLERQKAQVILPIIKELLAKHRIDITEIDELTVNPGPGSFTGVRVGVSIANALSFALGIPVNKINVLHEDASIEPIYQ